MEEKVLEEIKKDFAMYKQREVEIEDMRLKIEELKIGDKLNPISLEERVTSSKSCPNNDSSMYLIENLEKKIRLYEIKNRRVDNLLKLLDESEKKVIKILLIEKESKTKAKKILDRTGRQLDRYLKSGLDKIIKSRSC